LEAGSSDGCGGADGGQGAHDGGVADDIAAAGAAHGLRLRRRARAILLSQANLPIVRDILSQFKNNHLSFNHQVFVS